MSSNQAPISQPVCKDVVVLMPAYNEEKTIQPIIKKILSYVEKIIVVDDGSTDGTVMILKPLHITLLRHTHNQGKAASLIHGFKRILNLNIKGVITIDADGQHNPDDIAKFIAKITQHPNKVIIGTRLINKENAPKYRLLANKIADFFISWTAGVRIQDTQSGFRYYPKQLIETCLVSLKSNHFVFESEALIKAASLKFEIDAIAIASHYPKERRKSHYKPLRDSLKIIHMICWNLLKKGFNIKLLFQRKTSNTKTRRHGKINNHK